MTRAYSRQAWEEAGAAWDAGGFGPEWEPYRRLAAEAGFLWPPAGTAEDDREAESPSPRAIVWGAIADTPRMLRALIAASSSWAEVVAGILGDMERRRTAVDAAELATAAARADDPSRAQASETLREIGAKTAPEAAANPTPHARAEGGE